MGILISEYVGRFPAGLAPRLAVSINITYNKAEYAIKLHDTLNKPGFRVELDLRNANIGFEMRSHTLARVPYLLVVGDKEVESGCVSVRTQDGQDLGSMPVDAFATQLSEAVEQRSRHEHPA